MRVWIGRQAGGALALALVFTLALIVLSATTDEGNVAWGLRLARVVPLVPVPAAIAHALTVYRARSRGEARALEAVGIEPFSWQRWVALAALLPVLAGALALALGLDSSGLFPAASSAKACMLLDAGGFDCVQAGLRVRGAEVELTPPVVATVLTGSRAVWAAVTVVGLGLVLVTLAGAAVERPRYALAAVVLLLEETVVCQAVGAAVLAPWGALLLPGLGLLALALRRALEQTAMARVSSTRARA